MVVIKKGIFLLVILTLLAGCRRSTPPVEPLQVTQPLVTPMALTPTPSRTLTPTTTPTSTAMAYAEIRIWFHPAVPPTLENSIRLPPVTRIVANQEDANLSFVPMDPSEATTLWIFALVTPFSSLIDEIAFSDLRAIWNGQQDGPAILVTECMEAALEYILGKPDPRNINVVDAADLLDRAWVERDVLAVLPFEALVPRWKVVKIDGQSPVSNQFDINVYPLSLAYGWDGNPRAQAGIEQAIRSRVATLPTINRDPDKLTVLVMTGVTALVRATAVRMEEMSMTYPAEDIRDWLASADLTHISNEVSFAQNCPDPQMTQPSLFFCSKPEYIELLDYVGTDILDLTGNHGVDWGREALLFSLDLYRQRNWAYYAAGEDVFKAREAVTLEHNGNKFAFMGCNPAGPDFIWATETLPGVANCDYPWMWERISQLTSQGYNVIVTFQYFETYRHWVQPFEEQDFRSMANAGAVIVSGSQAHHPMAMEFFGDSFIHYGLGNLFFDQMWVDTVTIPEGTRKEFIDRHVFYDGRHISTELLTAILEDYARPRPMSPEERAQLLRAAFSASGW